MKAIAKSGNWRELRRVAETIRDSGRSGQAGRGAQGGRCLPAVLGIFVHGSRPLESRERGKREMGWQGERGGVGGEWESRGEKLQTSE